MRGRNITWTRMMLECLKDTSRSSKDLSEQFGVSAAVVVAKRHELGIACVYTRGPRRGK